MFSDVMLAVVEFTADTFWARAEPASTEAAAKKDFILNNQKRQNETVALVTFEKHVGLYTITVHLLAS